jgi:3-hydroxyacyl-[acyl-carrier-protein] dehydratase
MASAPFFDLSSIDLDRVVADSTVLDRYLRQTGRFRMLDGILHEDVGPILVGYKDIKGDDWWAVDHVPGRPMFPGALQIETAAQLAAYDYAAHRLDGAIADDKFVGFGGVEGARFRRLVQPDCKMIFVSNLVKKSRRMFRYQTQGFVDDALVFEADIIGVLV